MRIIYFIGTLSSGGKERRLIELLKFIRLNNNYEVMLILRQNNISFSYFYNLGYPYKILTKIYKKKDLKLPIYFLSICRDFKPDLIHTWGCMPTVVAILASYILHIPLINSQITSAPPKEIIPFKQKILNKINFTFSDIIISNSYAGIKSFNPPLKKSKVIYNGIDLKRFENLTDKDIIKNKYGIKTTYAVVMVASFSDYKDYDRYIRVANLTHNTRKDISFICIGGPGNDAASFHRAKKQADINPLIIITGIISEVEALVNACDICVLFSPQGEGISNAILEYMALGKSVIAYDIGGTKEIIKNGVNGILLKEENDFQVSKLISDLIDNVELREIFGKHSRKIIEERFTLDKMGKEYMQIYENDVQII